MKPRPSVVVARTVTRAGLDAERLARAAPRISSRMRREPRLLADEDAVGVDELASRRRARARRRRASRSSDETPSAVVRVGGEERADVAEVGGAEDRVDQRVRDHVAVGVAGEAARLVERDAAEDERHALLERVRVDADADAELLIRAAPGARSRPSKTVTVS